VKREAKTDAPIAHSPEDGPYDPNDTVAVDRYWDTAIVRRRGQCGQQKSPTKERITIRLSREVLDYFRSQGSGWQAQIDQSLKDVIKKRTKESTRN
jgi:uncharacterized protein (DUF4415 family)